MNALGYLATEQPLQFSEIDMVILKVGAPSLHINQISNIEDSPVEIGLKQNRLVRRDAFQICSIEITP